MKKLSSQVLELCYSCCSLYHIFTAGDVLFMLDVVNETSRL